MAATARPRPFENSRATRQQTRPLMRRFRYASRCAWETFKRLPDWTNSRCALSTETAAVNAGTL